ncbi:MAG TPA: hypothetical protein PLN86_16785 [Candidatus Hydrogenedentes bacterium]|nr:hypothetical protein [Candidatus Hydrogenedentota bacterium]
MISRLKYPLLASLLLLFLLLTSSLVSARPLSAVSLLEGRTYDQAHDTGYIDWAGTVQYIDLIHKDGSSLPPDEGGTYCGAGCRENVTRISDGSRVSGSFDRDTTYFEVMVAFSHDFNVGNAILSACSASTTYTLYAGPGFNLPGFVSMPLNVPAGCRTWTLAASGGYVDFRSVDVYYVAAPPTATATSTLPPTSTPTRTSIPSATFTATWTPTSTVTNTATYTPSPTATHTATSTFTFTPTNPATATATQTNTPSRTPTSTPTYTLTPSLTSTATATATATHTATPSRTPTSTATWMFTPSATNTATYTPIPTFTQTPTFTATATSTPSRTPTFIPTMAALPPAVSLTEHWWIWESGVLHVTPKTYPIASVKLTISDSQDRWPAVTLEIDPRKESELVVWDRRFADGTLAPSGEYPVRVRVCDDHNLCARAVGSISIPDGVWPTMTPTFTPTTTSTKLPSTTPTRTKIPASPTPVVMLLSPTPTTPAPQPAQWPLWQILGLAGLMIVIASASVVDPRPLALRQLGEALEQISKRNQIDSSQDEN